MNLIASVDLNWGIGRDGQLLFRVPADMQNLKRLTTGKIIVMGRNTCLSLPGGKPLPNRRHVILSEIDDFGREDLIVCASFNALRETLLAYASEDIFAFGGQSVYEQLLPYCDTAYITQFYAERPHDAALPRLDCSPDWRLERRSERQTENGLEFSFDLYRRLGLPEVL